MKRRALSIREYDSFVKPTNCTTASLVFTHVSALNSEVTKTGPVRCHRKITPPSHIIMNKSRRDVEKLFQSIT
jgi:hypothetical protein